MRRFYRTLNKLSKLYSKHPVNVYFSTAKDMKEKYGDCNFTGKSFTIRIAKCDWHTMNLILIHEFAHVLCWFDYLPEDDWHCDKWAVSYGDCWRAYSQQGFIRPNSFIAMMTFSNSSIEKQPSNVAESASISM